MDFAIVKENEKKSVLEKKEIVEKAQPKKFNIEHLRQIGTGYSQSQILTKSR